MDRRKHKFQSPKSENFVGDLLDKKNTEIRIDTVTKFLNDFEKTNPKRKENRIIKFGRHVAVFVTIVTFIGIIGNFTLSNYKKMYKWYEINILNPPRFTEDSTEYILGWEKGEEFYCGVIDSFVVSILDYGFTEDLFYKIAEYVVVSDSTVGKHRTRGFRIGYSDAKDVFYKRLDYSFFFFLQNPEMKQFLEFYPMEEERPKLKEEFSAWLKEPFIQQRDSLIREGLDNAKRHGWDIEKEKLILSEEQIMYRIAEAIEKNNDIQLDIRQELTDIKFDVRDLSRHFRILYEYDLR
jgi:hypothetical protein